jgi:pimeloyl-ACP methyl ester carboxylesterase
MPLADRTLSLRDGRSLAYAEWGDASGAPVVLFHGSPSSRLFCPNETVTASAAVRLITIDRPGYGGSDPDPKRSMLGWVDDVTELMDALELARFTLVAHSSGGPYALACATTLAPRLIAVGLVSSAAPLDEVPGAHDWLDQDERALVELARDDPAAAMRQIAAGAQWLIEQPELFLEAPRPEPDRALLAEPAVSAMFLAALREAVRGGLDGYACDEVLERRPWGLRLGDVNVDVQLWHGGLDPYIPLAHAEYMAHALPSCRPTFHSDDGHGLILSRWGEILSALRDAAREASTNGREA